MRLRAGLAAAAVTMTAVVLGPLSAGSAQSSDHPWSAPPAILVSVMKDLERQVYQGAWAIDGDGSRVAFFRSGIDAASKLLVRNVTAGHTRTVARPHRGFDVMRVESGEVPSPGYKRPDFTPDGRYLVFATPYRLVPEDRNHYADVYRYDWAAKAFDLVSVTPDGRPGDSESVSASVSDDGNLVVFTSGSTDLVPDDTNRTADVFVRDMSGGTTTRVSVSSEGAQTNRSDAEGWHGDYYGASFNPAVSADGTRIAFVSHADNLVPEDTNRAADAFVRDLVAGTTTRVSVTSTGEQLEPLEYSESASSFRDGVDDVELSGDGNVVLFQSHADGLVEDDRNANVDVFTHEIATGVTERVSEPTGGGDAYGEEARSCGTNGQCFGFYASTTISISHDGDRVFFMSGAPHMTGVDDDRGGRARDAFVHDRSTKVTQLVNRRRDGTWAAGVHEYEGMISADGRCVAYTSKARGIVRRDPHRGSDVFLQCLDDAAFGE